MNKLNNHFLSVGVLLLCLLLTACQSRLTPEQLQQHPKQLIRYYQTCQNESRDSLGGLLCQDIIRLNQDFEEQLRQASLSPKQFGQKILNTQQEIGQIQRQNQRTMGEVDRERLRQLNANVKRYYAVIRYLRIQ